jgi:predicted esterase
MKRILSIAALVVAGFVSLAPSCNQSLIAQGRKANSPLDAPLSRDRAARLASDEWMAQMALVKSTWGDMWNRGVLELPGGVRMPIFAAMYGSKPADGRSLFISMHGGGATTHEMNNEQWDNQKTLYAPAEGLYVAPRAAVDDWNMWFRPHIDTLFEAIIRIAVANHDVNPGKVYIMGYSAGGDGAYRLASRLADHWAAAAMMAGHPGETSPLNLRNTPFTMWMGANDNAYNRNTLVRKYSATLDSLHSADPHGYNHRLNMIPGAGHWMNNADTMALEWMTQFQRNPYPDRVVWRQEESALRQNFYWLSVPPADALPGRQAIVSRATGDDSGSGAGSGSGSVASSATGADGIVITIERCDYPTLYIDLNDRMTDLDSPVTVIRDGRRIFHGLVHRRAALIRSSVAERVDPDYIFSARLEITGLKVQAL